MCMYKILSRQVIKQPEKWKKRNLKFSLKMFAPSKFVSTKKKQMSFEKELELKFRSKWTASTKFASDKQMRKEMKERQLESQIQLNMIQSSLIWFKQTEKDGRFGTLYSVQSDLHLLYLFQRNK